MNKLEKLKLKKDSLENKLHNLVYSDTLDELEVMRDEIEIQFQIDIISLDIIMEERKED